MTITYALIQMVEKISERSDLARIINKAGFKSVGETHIAETRSDFTASLFLHGSWIAADCGPLHSLMVDVGPKVRFVCVPI